MVKDAIQQSWPMPAHPRPIVIFGAGSIVRDAHLPAYQAAGFPIAGLYDPDIAKAKSIGQKFNVPVLARARTPFGASLPSSTSLRSTSIPAFGRRMCVIPNAEIDEP